MTEDEEEDQFLLVEDDRMEDVIILSEPSSETEEQELLTSDRAAVIGTLELNTEPAKLDHVTEHVTDNVTEHVTESWSEDTSITGQTDQTDKLNRSTSESSVDIACQTEDTRSYTGAIVDTVVQGTFAGGKCIVDGCSNVLKSLNIGTAPGNFTGTLKEDIVQISSHLSGVLIDFGKELSLERIKYKLFL